MKRYLFLLISILLLCAILCACDTNGDKELPTSPEQVLSALAPEAPPLPISSVCKRITLTDMELRDVRDSFLNQGFGVITTDTVPSTKLETVVLKNSGWLVTLVKNAESIQVLWESTDDVTFDPLYAESNPPKGEVLMAQIGIPQSELAWGNPMNGMCYIYRLADGSAVIIDGGVGTEACADNLRAALGRLDIATDEDGKYRVAAWIITHRHGDHFGTFQYFAANYGYMIHLEHIMYSFPVESVAPMVDNMNDTEFTKIVCAFYPEVKRISPHAGLTYHFGDLSVQILYAPEFLYSEAFTVKYDNNTSLIFRVEVNGQSVLHMGDAGERAAEEAWKAHNEEAFRSNALQITHHGLYTGNESHTWNYIRKIYQATNADFGLLPMGSRQPGEARNGRYTVLVDWSRMSFQISFVTDTRNTHGNESFDQAYYDRFVADVAAGTAKQETLFGYNGVNLLKNREGMLTYIASDETAPMATVFTLSESGFTLLSNETLDAWLGK